MNNEKIEKIREKLRGLILDSISTYIDKCDIKDYIHQKFIDMVVEERIDTYISNMMADMLEEIADEIFDHI